MDTDNLISRLRETAARELQHEVTAWTTSRRSAWSDIPTMPAPGQVLC